MRAVLIALILSIVGCGADQERIGELERRLEAVEGLVPIPGRGVRATAFILTDNQGKERAEFSFLPSDRPNGGPGIHIRDQEGRVRVQLFCDFSNRGRLQLSTTEGGEGIYGVVMPHKALLVTDDLRVESAVMLPEPE